MRLDPTFWKGKPVFVTGATGLLGGWVTRRLLELGANVVVLVRDRVPRSILESEGMLSSVSTVHGALEDADLMVRALGEYEIDTVLHLAAQPIVGVAKRDPVSTLRTNVEGTWNVLEAARRTGTRQVIIASSDKAYGEADHLPYEEDHPLQGRYPYDCSKSCADLIAQMYHATYDMPVSIARCANLYGGGDLNFNRVIPGAIQATLNETPFVIRSDGQFIRDYLYIKDAADAYLALAQGLAAGAPQGPYNFSLDVKLTVTEVVDRVLRLMGREDLEPVILNQASAEIRSQYMRSEKARRLLGWVPAYSMDDGMLETIDWYRNYFGIGSAAAGPIAAAGV